eukprot:765030-Hanusia_phi.AAC.3
MDCSPNPALPVLVSGENEVYLVIPDCSTVSGKSRAEHCSAVRRAEESSAEQSSAVQSSTESRGEQR